jgi:putative tryptophan/tyrosine transport system substrate-binding protein
MPVAARRARDRIGRRPLIAVAAMAAIGGAAGASPLAAIAGDPGRALRLGVLMSTAADDPQEASSIAALVAELGRLGWVEGRNLKIDYRWGAGDRVLMQTAARELVALGPDVIFAKGASVPAAREATSTIPIVFVMLSDATVETYVASFAHPGGTITGFTSYERALVGKRLALLREMSPEIASVLYIRGRSTGTDTTGLYRRLAEDARGAGFAVTDGPANNDEEIEQAIQTFARAPNGGLIVAFDAFATVHRAKIIGQAARYRLPAIYPFRFFAQGGGLFSYGFNQDDQFRQAATYVARILGGEKPGDLPVQTPTKFELVINLKTAKALGLAIPPLLLARADEVIE